MTTNPAVADRRERMEEFVAWCAANISGRERAEAQTFLDRLFQAFGWPGAMEAGATFERPVRRRETGTTTFADLLWQPRVLIEMKARGEELSRHYRQAWAYWYELVPDRPKYVVLCNFDELWVYDLNYQNDEPVDRVRVEDLPDRWEVLTFLLPVEEPPRFANDLVQLTRDTAGAVSGVFNSLLQRHVPRAQAQRFTLQSVMAMFAEDIGLLPRHSFHAAVEDSLAPGGNAYDLIFGLFREMDATGVTPAGRYEGTPYFNGGLFREVTPFELEREELERLDVACEADWSQVRPAIFGTLFEQSLEHDERRAQGAHYTSETDIQRVVRPTIVRPWEERIEAATTLAELAAVEQDLHQYRVLDPACGCGNFLYVAYRELRRLERQLHEKTLGRRRAEGAEAEMRMSFVSTAQFYGLDSNAFAVEIAKVTLMLARKLAADELGDVRQYLPLDDLDDNFIAQDALNIPWPEFDVCIGNPPYLGRRRIAQERGAGYAAWLLDEFPQVGGASDYVSYWFRKTHDLMPEGGLAGLVGTNSIREGDTRAVTLDYITENDGVIFDAVSSKPWSGEANVFVSIVNWAKGTDVTPKTLWLADGTQKLEVEHIPPSLSPLLDIGGAGQLTVNRRPKRCHQGQTPGHAGFVLTPEEARDIIEEDPVSAEVIHPYLIGNELNTNGRPSRLVIDIPAGDQVAARHWRGAYDHVRELVLPDRQAAAEAQEQANAKARAANPNANPGRHHINFLARWWKQSWRREDLITAIEQLPRYIALSRVAVVARQSVYEFVDPAIRPGDRLQVFTLADDYSFGVLHSSYHRAWLEGRGTTQGRAITYSPRVFETFPWPQGPSQEAVDGVVDVVADLIAFREQRVQAGDNLIELYDTLRDPGVNPLRDLHERLDEAVRVAYEFSKDDDILDQMLALNTSMLELQEEGVTCRPPGDHGLLNATRTTYRITSDLP